MLLFWITLISAVVLGGLLLLLSRFMILWLQALVSGANVSLFSLILMPLRKVDPRVIVLSKVMIAQAGLNPVSTNLIEAQYLAGGDVPRVTLALIAAQRANIDLDWNTAAAIDLAGRDILEAVQISVNPRVINCPALEPGSRPTLDGVAGDGIQLEVRALVTVRTNLFQLIGGATESTVIARVGQGIVSAIGGCKSYREILNNPSLISQQVLAKGLDSQTSFEIISIDIANIEIGENIGARIQLDQANADIRIALAHAEKRKAMAIARQQEMMAMTRENEALLVLEEAKIPTGIANAFREGQLRTPNSLGLNPYKQKRLVVTT
ncbi:MAG: hypothetical protein CMJ46_07555 [Planctomyces sp.]|nr:hypothetical protein [Planctomyces sp.]